MLKWRFYHEKSKSITHTFHEQLVLSKIVLIDSKDFCVVHIADEEQCNKESDYHIDTCETQYTRS